MRLTLRSFAALPASSRTSAVRYSRTAVTYTAAAIRRKIVMKAPYQTSKIERRTLGANAHLVLSVVPQEALDTATWEL